MSTAALWGVILAMGALTFLLRNLFILFGERIHLPGWFREAQAYVPVAVLAAIVAPAFFPVGGDVGLAEQVPRWVAGAVGVVVAATSRQLVAVLVAGMLTLWGLQALIG